MNCDDKFGGNATVWYWHVYYFDLPTFSKDDIKM